MILMVLCLGTGEMWGQAVTFENSNSTTTFTTNNITYTTNGSGTSTSRFSQSLKFINLGSGKQIQFVSTTNNISRIEIKACSNNSSAKKCITIKTTSDGSSYSVPSTYTATLDGSSSGIEDISLTGTSESDWQTLVVNLNANSTLPSGFQILRGSNNLSVYSVKIYTAPTAFTASSITSSGATFNITDGANANNYDFYYNTSSTAPLANTSPTTSVASAKTKAITGLDGGTRYYAWVRSTWSSGSVKGDWRAMTGTYAYFETESAGDVAPAISGITGGNASASVNQKCTLTVSMSAGTNLSYQWKESSDNSNWSNVSSGGTAATYIATAPATATSHYYKCYVSNSAGNATSGVATITVPSYTMSYNANGGDDGSVPASSETCAKGATYTVLGNSNSLSKTGYSALAYWNTADDGSGSDYAISSGTFTASANVTLYAKWSQSITVNPNTANGGSTSGAITILYNATGTASFTAATGAIGYSLLGYYSAATGGVKILNADGSFAGTNVSVSEDAYISSGKWVHSSATTLYPQYELLTYDLTASATVDASSSMYNVSERTGAISGASITNASVEDVPYGTEPSVSSNTFTVGSTTVTAPATVDGTAEECYECVYVFDHWENIPATVSADVSNIHAVYKTRYSLSYDLQSGDWTSGDDEPATYIYGTGVTLPTSSTVARDGYRLDGWKEGNEGETVTAVATTDYGDMTYYAQWTAVYAVSKSTPSNGDFTISPTTAAAGATISLSATPSVGYALSAWTITKTSDGTDVTDAVSLSGTTSATFTMPAYGVTVAATFAVQQFTLSYNNGGASSGSVPSTPAAGSYDSGTEITVPSNSGSLVKGTDVFRGWTDGTTFYKEGQKFNINSDVTLTAVWDGGTSCTEYEVLLSSGSLSTESSTAPKGYYITGRGLIMTSSDGSSTLKALSADQTTCHSSTSCFTTGSNIVAFQTYNAINKLTVYGIATGNRTLSSIKTGTTRGTYGDDIQGDCTVKVNGSTDSPTSHITWSKDACGEIEITFPNTLAANTYILITFSGNLNIYGALFENCTKSNFTVSFNMKGHGDAVSSYVGVPTGKKIVAPTAPTAEGYTFGGWYTDSGCSTPVDWGSMTITADKTLYAKWTANTYNVAVTLTDDLATKKSGSTGTGAATHGTDHTLTFEAVSGFQLPSDVTVTIGGDTKTKGTEYSWSISAGVGTLTIDGDYILGNIAITVTAEVAKTDPEVYTVSGTTSVCEGDEATITLSDSEDGVTYHLYKGEDDQDEDKVGDGDEITWTVTAAGTYTVKVEEDEDYNEATMEGSAVISYKTATAITTQPTTPVSGHDGVDFTLGSDLDATGQGTLTYKWYSYTSAESAGEAVVAGETSSTYTTSKSAGTYYYKIEVKGDCGSVKSGIITVTVDNKHKLTYDANGGSGAPEAEYRAEGTASLSATEPTRSNYRFLGWNTKDDGTGDHYDAEASYTMGLTAVTLYAEWGETATLTWSPNVNTAESSIGTASKGSNNARISNSTDMTNLANYGSLTITSSAKENLTSKIETPSTYNSGKYLYVTFDVPENYEFVPTSISVKVQPVGDGEDKYTILDISDENSHSLRSTAAKCDGTTKGKLTTVTLEGDETALTGTVTLKIYVYNYSGTSTSNNCYRLGSPITIAGNVNYVCPERATITSPTAPQSIKLYTDQSKTLSVSATKYAGTLNYQWQKDGVDIDGATSATYTVVGSSLTVGTTYKYTCNVSETDPASCETVISPAVSITAASPDCGYTEIASAVLTSASAATPTGCTARVNLGGKDDGDPEGCYKMTGKNKYFALILSQAFQVGDSIFFKLFTKTSIAAINIHATGATDTIGTLIHSRTLVSGDYGKDTIIGFVVTPEMATTLNTNKKVAIFRNNTDNKQNHCLYWIKVKRYGCPDIVVFDDAKGNGNWSDEDNWIGANGHGATPTIDDRVVINKPMTVDVDDAQAAEIILDQSGSNTGKLTIGAGQALVVAGTIKTYDGSSYSATTPSDIVLESDGTHGTGALITGERSTTTQATVGFYTKAIQDAERGYVNQYIGIPFSGITAYDRFYDTYIYEYIASSNAWSPLTNNGEMSPYTAYNLMRDEDTETTLYSGGTLVLPGTAAEYKDHDLTLTLRNASATTTNMFANPYTAPIDITAMNEDDDFTGVDATIYLFNSGSKDDVDNRAAQAGSGAGQWLVLPVASVKASPGSYAVTTIPSQQAFMVKGNSGSATHKVTIDYKKHVYDPAKTSGATINPARAPKRVSEETTLETMNLTVQGLGGASDRVLMFMREDFSTDFDNGWDGRKMKGKTYAPYLYAATDDGKMAVNSIPTAEGTVLGFKAGTEDNYYTFSFNYNGEDNWYLNDLKEQKSTLIHAAETYEFVAEPGDTETRFVISATPIHKITTGNESASAEAAKVRKLIIDDKIYIIRGGRMYSVDGQMIK